MDYDLDILVGDAAAGEGYFNLECVACHSVTGDLMGIASRIVDDYDLQNRWVAGGQISRGGSAGLTNSKAVTRRLQS